VPGLAAGCQGAACTSAAVVRSHALLLEPQLSPLSPNSLLLARSLARSSSLPRSGARDGPRPRFRLGSLSSLRPEGSPAPECSLSLALLLRARERALLARHKSHAPAAGPGSPWQVLLLVRARPAAVPDESLPRCGCGPAYCFVDYLGRNQKLSRGAKLSTPA
jgi:hypothetical protein